MFAFNWDNFNSHVSVYESHSLSRARLVHDLAHESFTNSYDFTSLTAITFSMSYEREKHQNVCITDYRECPKPSLSVSHLGFIESQVVFYGVTLFKLFLEYVYIKAINECDESDRERERRKVK